GWAALSMNLVAAGRESAHFFRPSGNQSRLTLGCYQESKEGLWFMVLIRECISSGALHEPFEWREASWSAPVPWRFEMGDERKSGAAAHALQDASRSSVALQLETRNSELET